MSNDHIKSEISAYLAGGLPEARNLQIEAHVAACEKCRQALAKMRAKQARQKREALKKASPDPLPNLFLARQGKNIDVDRPSSKAPWILAAVVVAAGAVYGLHRHFTPGVRSSDTAESAPAPARIEVSSAPVSSSATVPVPSPAPLPPKAAPPSAAVPAPSPAHELLQVKQMWKGADSGIKTSRLGVIRNREAWEKLWAEMQEKEPLPSVNFNRHVVICIFAGGRPSGASVQLGRIREDDEEVTVSYSVSGPEVAVSSAPVSVSTASAAAPSHPYLLSMLPRVDKKIRLTQREVP
jgi:hypothetical protein